MDAKGKDRSHLMRSVFLTIIAQRRKRSNSSKRQNSPNDLFTEKRFKLLSLGSPCWARTSDTLINSQVLVPTELRRNGFRGSPLLGRSSDIKRRKNTRETLFSFPCCVGYELSSRAVSSQVLLPLQRLTSVFGMGTGGPTALK